MNSCDEQINYTIPKLPKRILSSLLTSVSAGVVPRTGSAYMAIGRDKEINIFLKDLDEIETGASKMRFIIGKYGSGKSFLIHLIRSYALERGYLTCDCDLNPKRNLYGTDGSGIATYKELIKNLATKSSPDGGALSILLMRWLDSIRLKMNTVDRSIIFNEIKNTLISLENYVGGFDFAKVVMIFFEASLSDEENDENDKIKASALKWLRGEYTTKTSAKNELGFTISCIINDNNWYDFLKLWSALSQKIGYKGLIVFIDECVNLYKIPNRIKRDNNYEMILSMFNDTLQGNSCGMELILGGTPQFLEDTRRGLFGYEALKSRLSDSKFMTEGFQNYFSPVIRLQNLNQNELFALIIRLTALHGQYYNYIPTITGDNILSFLNIYISRIGTDVALTPRELIRDWMEIINILYSDSRISFDQILHQVATIKEQYAKNEDSKATHDYQTSDLIF